MAQYFNNVDLKSDIKKFSVDILNHSLKFYSDNGVFCKGRLDFGTRLLLENIDWNNVQGPILDMGCGYGPIGILAAKVTDYEVVMCDVNKRALHLAERSAKDNDVEVSIIESDTYSNIIGKFGTIITNPPIRAGKQIIYDMLFGANDYLINNGTLYFVIHKDQGAKTVIKDLEKTYNVEVLAKNKGFFVIKCKIR